MAAGAHGIGRKAARSVAQSVAQSVALSAAVAAASVSILAGCGGTDGSAANSDAPKGYTKQSAAGYMFFRPTNWHRKAPPRGWVANYELTKGGKAVGQLGVISGGLPRTNDSQLVCDGSMAALQIHARSYKSAGVEKLRVAGVKSASRLDFSYSEVTSGGVATGATWKGTDVCLAPASRKAVVVRVLRKRAAVPVSTVTRIVHSVAAKAGG